MATDSDLKTYRLTLYKLSLNELNTNYISWLNDKDVCKYNSHGDSEYTYDMAVKYISDLCKDKSKIVYAVYEVSSKLHIGNISLQEIDYKNKSAEIAFLFGEKLFWGKGYASEAANALIQYGFDVLKLERICFGTHEDNVGMQKIGDKLGFKKEGVRRSAFYKNDQFYDIYEYGLLNGEYQDKR